MMSRAIQFQNHPFRFLLYLEWGLLAVAITGILTAPPPPLRELSQRGGLPVPARLFDQWPLFTIGCLLIFGLLGLYLPTKGFWLRLGHITLQTVLIVVTSGLMLWGARLFPFAYLILVIRSCLMMGLMGRVMVTSLAFLLFMTTLGLRFRGLDARLPRSVRHLISNLQMNLVVFFGLSLVFTLLLVNALLNERTVQTRLKTANEELKRSATQVKQLATAQERSRIAREIHDSLGHSLTALNIQLEGAIKLSRRDPQKAQTLLTEAKRLGSVALQDVRQSVATLREDTPSKESFYDKINALVETLQTSTGITPNINIQLLTPLPEATNMTLYRIAQEGITNIVKHAQATAVELGLVANKTGIRLLLRDNGRGFDLSQTSTGFGLQGMRERAQAIGGQLTLKTQPGKGCELQLTIPAQQLGA
ncbi:MAG: sensor histidine kinase [Cyanobacteria bacterium P01_H01_bin.21]